MGRATLVIPPCHGRGVMTRNAHAGARIGGHITFEILWWGHLHYMGWMTTTYQYAPHGGVREQSSAALCPHIGGARATAR
jgi:hypothetical protein